MSEKNTTPAPTLESMLAMPEAKEAMATGPRSRSGVPLALTKGAPMSQSAAAECLGFALATEGKPQPTEGWQCGALFLALLLTTEGEQAYTPKEGTEAFSSTRHYGVSKSQWPTVLKGWHAGEEARTGEAYTGENTLCSAATREYFAPFSKAFAKKWAEVAKAFREAK